MRSKTQRGALRAKLRPEDLEFGALLIALVIVLVLSLLGFGLA
ncbi:MAG TPA: hypothetical protein VGB99_07150 [Acidobacteriota bacterium]